MTKDTAANRENERKQPMPDILFEDNHVLVALKQPNVLTQGDSTGDEDLLTTLKKYIKEKYDKPGNVYLGLVHRMDRPVGGLLVFARTSKAAERLSRQLKDKTLGREYVCLAGGRPPREFTLKDYLEKDAETNMVRVVPKYTNRGKEAVLHARTLLTRDEGSLVTVRLETGRAHQIRVQMANASFPLLGDHRYGGAEGKSQIALWGMRLSFNHPIDGKPMVFLAPPPGTGLWTPFRREIEGLMSAWPRIAEQQPLQMQ